MEKFTIIWDFDGTILPLAPFDSEQSLLLYRMNQPEEPFGLMQIELWECSFGFRIRRIS